MTAPLPGMGWGFGGGGAMAFSSIFSAEKIKQQPESSGFPGRCRPGRKGSRTGSGTGSVPPAPKGGQRPPAPAQRLGKLEAGACRQAARAGGCQLCPLPAQPGRDGTPGPVQSPGVPGRPWGSQAKEQSWTRPPTTRGEEKGGYAVSKLPFP